MDIAPSDPDADPVRDADAIVKELRRYDEALFHKPRWLVVNKVDLLPEEERTAKVENFRQRLSGPPHVFAISALTGEGCRALCFAIMDYLDANRARETVDVAHDEALPEGGES